MMIFCAFHARQNQVLLQIRDSKPLGSFSVANSTIKIEDSLNLIFCVVRLASIPVRAS